MEWETYARLYPESSESVLEFLGTNQTVNTLEGFRDSVHNELATCSLVCYKYTFKPSGRILRPLVEAYQSLGPIFTLSVKPGSDSWLKQTFLSDHNLTFHSLFASIGRGHVAHNKMMIIAHTIDS